MAHAKAKQVKVEVAKRNDAYKMKVVFDSVMTEKASTLASVGVYIFSVAKGANKIEVARDIKGAYGVKPRKVNMIRRKGKAVRTGKVWGKRSSGKRAIVMLPDLKRLPIFEQT